MHESIPGGCTMPAPISRPGIGSRPATKEVSAHDPVELLIRRVMRTWDSRLDTSCRKLEGNETGPYLRVSGCGFAVWCCCGGRGASRLDAPASPATGQRKHCDGLPGAHRSDDDEGGEHID